MNDQSKWEGRVFRYDEYGGSGLYYVKLQHAGRRGTFCTQATTRKLAAGIARRIYMELKTLGWEATLAKRKPEELKKQNAAPVTVDEFLAQVIGQYTGQPRTIHDNARVFRRLVADIAGIERDERKYDYAKGGRLEWISKVNAVQLDFLTPERIAKWKADFLNAAGDDLAKRRRAMTSVNTYLRQCRSLFSSKRCLDSGVTSSFGAIKFEPVADMRYRSTIDVSALCQAALVELKPEPLKAFLLALGAGLRRNEIDKLEWTAFNWEAGTLHVGPTKYLHIKSERSIGDVDLDSEVLAFFRGFYAQATTRFVIASDIDARPRAAYCHYRARKMFRALTQWLREKGVKSIKALHDLRKEFGSQINQEHGIHAASAALRHADIGITSRHYVAKKTRTTAGLGAFITPNAKVVSIESVSSPVSAAESNLPALPASQ